MKKEIPILFSTPMVQAILEGRKTMTRRIVKWTKEGEWSCFNENPDDDDIILPIENCPYGKSGDVLWVRETVCEHGFEGNYLYRADGVTLPTDSDKWTPSIHMPKDACRIWLEVIEVKAERLQDITEEDAISEGVLEYEDGTYKNYFTQRHLRESDGVVCMLAKGSFQSLWCSISGLDNWNINPWVWVVSFKVLSTGGRP